MAELSEGLNEQAIRGAFDVVAGQMQVTGVESSWSPVGEQDTDLARSAARVLLAHIEKTYPDIDPTTKDVLIHFGTAAGALSLRQLFHPFQSDQILVRYTEESGLDQTDAVRRVVSGMRAEPARSTILSAIEE